MRFSLLLLLAAAAYAQLPDPHLTPGDILHVSAAEVCQPGYTKHVRHVTTATKRQVFRAYGIPWSRRAAYEVDHLVSLELGGSNTIDNLWPEPYAGSLGARVKDRLENRLHRQVCAGTITLDQAQAEIAEDWIRAYRARSASRP